MEGTLSRAFSHGGRRTRSCRYARQDPVDVGSPTPFLVRKDIASDLLLSPLDELDIREHAVCLVPLRKFGW